MPVFVLAVLVSFRRDQNDVETCAVYRVMAMYTRKLDFAINCADQVIEQLRNVSRDKRHKADSLGNVRNCLLVAEVLAEALRHARQPVGPSPLLKLIMGDDLEAARAGADPDRPGHQTAKIDKQGL